MLNKKLLLNTIIFSFLLLFPCFLYAQTAVKPKITVFPLENPEKDLQIEVISRNVQRTVELNLKMMDTYIVENNNISTYSGNNDWLLNYSTRNNIDNIIFGKAVVTKTGSVTLQMSVFNKANKSVTLTKTENAETLFDIFKASDLLAIGMIEGFSGLTLGFGELKFTNSGEKGRYSVYIDNVLAGEDITSLTTIMTGNKTIKITQERMFGNYIVYNQKALVEEKKITEVIFNIPGFVSRETKAIEREEKIINKNWDDKYSKKTVDNSFERLFEALKAEGYSESEAAKKRETEERYLAWGKQKENWTGRITILDKQFGISFFFRGGWSNNSYEDKVNGINFFNLEDSSDFAGTVGVSFSANMPYNFALQTGFEYTFMGQINIRDNFNTGGGGFGPTPPQRGEQIEIDLLEVPILLLYRLPGKYISLYAGPVFQVRVTGTDYAYYHDWDFVNNVNLKIDDATMPIKNSGWAFALGVKGEIPLSGNVFFETGIRYTAGITDRWIDSDDYYLSLNYFQIVLGLGVKFGK
ncbi:MAG: hypothetical protein FWE72_05095 [Spirochaetaceae bacterium]|nr:hypothetical protein [Spirochaetaceae bacterium]